MKRIITIMLALLLASAHVSCAKIIKKPDDKPKGEQSAPAVSAQSGETTAATGGPAGQSDAAPSGAESVSTEKTSAETRPVGVNGVKFSVQELSLKIGEEYMLAVIVLPEDATDQRVTVTIPQNDIISYTDGRVTALRPGRVRLTAVTNEDGYVAYCTVTVIADGTDPTETPTETPIETTVTPTETTVTPTETTETPTETVETPTETVETPTETTVTPAVTPENPLEYKHYEYDFEVDLSEYELYMDPQGNDYLILVNAEHPLPKDYVPSDLTPCINTRQDGRDTQTMRLYAAMAMEAMMKEAEAAGMLYKNRVEGHESKILSLTTAYRSYSYQKYLFESYVERETNDHPEMSYEEVVALVSTYSCPPGTSEHQTGLCTDMHNWPTAGRYMAKEFADSPAGTWLRENCYKFGFILRFPEDKTQITGITFESWHYRYVGRYHATRMHELNMCLEEYLDYLTQFGYVINEGLL